MEQPLQLFDDSIDPEIITDFSIRVVMDEDLEVLPMNIKRLSKRLVGIVAEFENEVRGVFYRGLHALLGEDSQTYLTPQDRRRWISEFVIQPSSSRHCHHPLP